LKRRRREQCYREGVGGNLPQTRPVSKGEDRELALIKFPKEGKKGKPILTQRGPEKKGGDKGTSHLMTRRGDKRTIRSLELIGKKSLSAFWSVGHTSFPERRDVLGTGAKD